MSEEIIAQPQATDDKSNADSNVPTTTQVEEVKQAKIKVKFNHEELEIPYEEAVTHIQKGLNYDKIQEKLIALESDPSRSFLERQAKKHNMNVNEYLDAVQKAEEQENLNKLIQENIPENLAKEILESRKFREQWEQDANTKKEQQKREKDYQEFMENFPDVKPDTIPRSVWEDVNKGRSLTDSYARYENKLLKEELGKAKHTQQVAEASTGSISGNGSTNPTYFTREQVENMSTQDVIKNYKAVMDSRKNWK